MPALFARFLVLSLVAVAPSFGATGLAQVPAGLERSEPIVCRGMNDIVLVNRYIETDGNGVEILGNCDVEIVGSHIVAGGVGVLVASNGDVTIHDSYVEGANGGLVVTGNGDIEYRSTTVRGGTRVTGNGDITDLGGNDVDGVAAREPVEVKKTLADGTIGPIEILVVDADGNIIVTRPGGVRIEGQGEVVAVTPDGEVNARSHGDEIRVTPLGRVTVATETETVVVDGAYVSIRPGTTAKASGDWRAEDGDYGAADTNRILDELGATESEGEIALNLAGDVLFEFDSADVRPQAAAQLSKLAHVLRQRASADIFVDGHTDSVGGDAYNQKLSEQRAVSVMHWLNTHESIPAYLMKGRGLGAKKPIAYNTMPNGSDNPEGRAKNRRVEIRFASR